MKHLLNICNINGAEVEPYPIAVTKSRFKADSGLNNIILKFKGRIYYDGCRDAFGHILFGENKYEYIPAGSVYRESFVIIHDSERTSTGYKHISKKSTAKVEIMSE